MARYYSYGRGRYGRRYYRRGNRRYGGTSLRRYRSVQMNDSEIKVMTFSTVISRTLTPTAEGATSTIIPVYALGGTDIEDGGTYGITSSAGRPFYAGMMFDRVRVRSLHCTIRPLAMPSTTATNYTLYTAWDRYGSITDAAVNSTYNIQTDPSSKQITWSAGGSGSALRTWIYSMARDRYQYSPIQHSLTTTPPYWTFNIGNPALVESAAPFNPTLLLALQAVTTPETSVQLTLHFRAVLEFQGGYSVATLNYTGSAVGTNAQTSAASIEERVAALERMYNSNPADNNDDLVSVLNELSNPQ